MSALREALGWDDLPAVGHSVAVLIRHAERPPIPPNDPGNHLPLTDGGWQQAEELGRSLGAAIKSLSTSPVRRCVETAEGIRRGAGFPLEIMPDRMLGHPGVLTADPELAWKTWCEWGHQRMYRELMEGLVPPPGMADPVHASQILATHMLRRARNAPGLHVFVTHDLFIATLVARFFGTSFDQTRWPPFLTGLALWPDGGRARLVYHGRECWIDLAASHPENG